MGFTDETVRFNLDDSNKKEISVVILRTYLAITMLAIKSANMSAMRLLRS